MKGFDQFIRERQYLQNVSPRTVEWHQQSLKWLGIEEPNEDDLKRAVLRMREAVRWTPKSRPFFVDNKLMSGKVELCVFRSFSFEKGRSFQ